MLGQFNEATIELSEEKRVSASKIHQLLKMVSITLGELLGSIHTDMAKRLNKSTQLKLMESLKHWQKTSILTLPTLLDPNFKTLGFLTPSKADEAVKRLTTECGQVISDIQVQSSPLASAAIHEDEVPSTSCCVYFVMIFNQVSVYWAPLSLSTLHPQSVCPDY